VTPFSIGTLQGYQPEITATPSNIPEKSLFNPAVSFAALILLSSSVVELTRNLVSRYTRAPTEKIMRKLRTRHLHKLERKRPETHL
jgi:hypothetical protein